MSHASQASFHGVRGYTSICHIYLSIYVYISLEREMHTYIYIYIYILECGSLWGGRFWAFLCVFYIPRFLHTPFALSEEEQDVWPWSQPFLVPEEEGVCMEMTTSPSLSEKRKECIWS